MRIERVRSKRLETWHWVSCDKKFFWEKSGNKGITLSCESKEEGGNLLEKEIYNSGI